MTMNIYFLRLKFVGLIRTCLICTILISDTLQADSSQSQGLQIDTPLGPETKIVEKWRGTWDVKAMRRRPHPAQEVTYVETFDWILDGRYLRSETSRKSDGGKSMTMFWYDVFNQTYQYVIYYASGLVAILPPPAWNDSTQTMEWKSGLFSPISYNAYATFTDRDTIRWKSLWKDWKGTVILDIEGTSHRRK